MPSDPSTKDLIAAAREVGYKHLAGFHQTDALRTVLALADRLEEVEEERQYDLVARRQAQAWEEVYDLCRELGMPVGQGMVLPRVKDFIRRRGSMLDPDSPEAPGTPDPCSATVEIGSVGGRVTWHCLLREGHDGWHEASGSSWGREVRIIFNDHSPDTDSPEPSDPEPLKRLDREADGVRWTHSVPKDPEPEDVLRTSAPAQVPATGCEPEDDPWEQIERWSKDPSWSPTFRFGPAVRDALLDLRKRVEDEAGLRRRADSDAVTVRGEMLDRLTTLEGHADRGNEAEKGLRDWIHRLIQEDNHARKVRAILRDDLEKIDDFTEALAGRVEELETEVQVARHMRLQMLGRLSELAKCSTCGGTGRVNGVECICGGHGSRDAEVDGFATALHEAESERVGGKGER